MNEPIRTLTYHGAPEGFRRFLSTVHSLGRSFSVDGMVVKFGEPVEYDRKFVDDLGDEVEVVTEKDPESREPGDPAILRVRYEDGAEADRAACHEAAFTPLVLGERSIDALAVATAISVDDLLLRTPRKTGRRDVLATSVSEAVTKDPAHKGRVKVVITTDGVDRMGDILDIPGWVLKNYARNPIVLFDHDYGAVGDSPPSQARSMELIVQKHRIVSVAQFHLLTRFNLELYAMYTSDPPFMNTTSVGFWPLEMPERIVDEEGRTTGFRFGRKDLLEWSFVAVPANADAFQLAAKKGLARPRTIDYLSSLSSSFAGPSRTSAGEKGHNADRDALARAHAFTLRARSLST